MGLSSWLKNQTTAMVIALSSIEKNALGQGGGNLGDVDGTHQRLNQGRLSDDLLRGELSQQVKEIRWRTYKILQEVDKRTTKVNIEYENGIKQVPIYNEDNEIVDYRLGTVTGRTSESIIVDDGDLHSLENLSVDPYDDYQPELCVINDDIPTSVLSGLKNDNMDVYSKPIENKNENGEVVSVTHGEITSELHTSTNSSYDKSLLVEREYRPRIEIERFTKRMVVREINGTEKLLEFYISKYPDEDDRRTNLVIAECKKILRDKKRSDMIELYKVGFITMGDIGVSDYKQYEYEVIGFDKVVDYDGNYILKFKANVTLNGENILSEFIDEELEERYKNNEKKEK